MKFQALVVVKSLTNPDAPAIILEPADVQMTYDYAPDHLPSPEAELVVKRLVITYDGDSRVRGEQ